MQCPVGILFYASCIILAQQKLLVASDNQMISKMLIILSDVWMKINELNFCIQETRKYEKLATRIFELANFDSQIGTRNFQLATRKINSHTTTRNSQISTRNSQNQLTCYNSQLANFNSQLAARKINSQATTRNSQILTRNSQNQLASYNSQLALATINSQLADYPNPRDATPFLSRVCLS